jgi:hypothetical protein
MDTGDGKYSVRRFSITTIDGACQCTAHLISGQCVEHCKPSLSAENSACFESPPLKRHPGTLARDSVDRASAVFRYDGV